MFLGKKVRVILKEPALSSYLELKKRTDKDALMLIRAIEQRKEILNSNPQYGDPMAKNLIPKEFLDQGITNLYHIELPNFWRMLYTLKGNKVEIFLIILSITDHPSYDKLLGYKKR